MKYKIGVYGSATEKRRKAINKAKEVGYELSKHNVVIITGACAGLPYETAYEAAKNGVEVWGFSPEIDFENQKKFLPKVDLSIFKKLIYVPKDFPFVSDSEVCKKYRNVISTANCDAGIIISGRWGTLNEFTNLYDMGKLIGIVEGSGGVADELSRLCQKITKKSAAKVFFEKNPSILVRKILNELNRSKKAGGGKLS